MKWPNFSLCRKRCSQGGGTMHSTVHAKKLPPFFTFSASHPFLSFTFFFFFYLSLEWLLLLLGDFCEALLLIQVTELGWKGSCLPPFGHLGVYRFRWTVGFLQFFGIDIEVVQLFHSPSLWQLKIVDRMLFPFALSGIKVAGVTALSHRSREIKMRWRDKQDGWDSWVSCRE